MKASNLMIGDWVQVPSELNRYKRIRNTFDMDEAVLYKPIPLTKEILEKNGFKKVEETEYSCTYYTLIPTGYEKNSYTCKFTFYKEPIMGVSTLFDCWGWIPPQNGGMNDIHVCNLKNLHQLQHAFKLCRIEKEIIL